MTSQPVQPSQPNQPTYPTAPPARQHLAYISDARRNGGLAAVAWICTVLTLGYMLPWAIAAQRGKSNQAAIGVLTLLLGWTVVGWVVALVMACGAHQAVPTNS
jgi:hypothetical protein